eukprot:IDg18866t1
MLHVLAARRRCWRVFAIRENSLLVVACHPSSRELSPSRVRAYLLVGTTRVRATPGLLCVLTIRSRSPACVYWQASRNGAPYSASRYTMRTIHTPVLLSSRRQIIGQQERAGGSLRYIYTRRRCEGSSCKWLAKLPLGLIR